MLCALENDRRSSTRSTAILQTHSDQEALDLGDYDDLQPATDTEHSATHDSPSLVPPNRYGKIISFWQRHITISASASAARDHLANERTALSYIRSAQAFAITGVVISQLLRILHAPNPNPTFGFFVVSIPLAAVCHAMALVVTVIGCWRFLHWQSALSRGDALSSGWEFLIVFGLTGLILLCMFVMVVGIIAEDIDR